MAVSIRRRIFKITVTGISVEINPLRTDVIQYGRKTKNAISVFREIMQQMFKLQISV